MSRKKNTTTAATTDITDMKFWRSMAKQLVPAVKDDWQESEVATILYSFCDALSTEYAHVSKLCDKAETKAVAVSVGVTLSRKAFPPDVAVRLRYAEKYLRTVKKTVPDPKTMELPFDAPKEDE